jgi:hypothetical protein
MLISVTFCESHIASLILVIVICFDDIYRSLKLSPKRHETAAGLAPAAVSDVTPTATAERPGREHRPNSMERAASHKVEQWLSCSTSRLAADSTLSPKVRIISTVYNSPWVYQFWNFLAL